MKATVIGTGYVGSVTAACLAHVGHDVHGFDVDPHRARELEDGRVPFYEPGLAELVTSSIDAGRLHFSGDPADALNGADLVFLCVGTPPGPGDLPDMYQFRSAADLIAPYLEDGMGIVNKSTVPVGSGNWVRTMLEDALPTSNAPRFDVVSNPEFLREGSAIEDFFYPDRIVLGGREDAVCRVAALYEPILEQSFPSGRPDRKPRLIRTDLASAEMIKYAANAFLATKVSFANEIANICELVGADVRQVLPAIGADERIGPRFLGAGLGWGGSCFGKDVAALTATALEYGYGASMLRATVEINQAQRAAVMRKLQQHLKTLKGRRIALLGLAFKPETDDLRDSPALDLASRLTAAGAVVTAYDPIVKELPDAYADVRLADTAVAAAVKADAVIVATEWAEFTGLIPADFTGVMAGRLIVDGRNCLDTSKFAEAGLTVVGVGW